MAWQALSQASSRTTGRQGASANVRVTDDEIRPISHETGVSECAESQNRTGDTRFFRPVLYRLSYLGKKAP
jgi:hypothetical protein